MPIFRASPINAIVDADRRLQLIVQLKQEISGTTTPNGPVIFEIPLDLTDMTDVMVVWEKWNLIRPEDRTSIIQEAYTDQKIKIAQALGVTYREAIDQQILPYAVIPMVRKQEGNLEELKSAMIAMGGIALEGGKVDLRFPTMNLAEQAHRDLTDKFPKGYWSIVQSVGQSTGLFWNSN